MNYLLLNDQADCDVNPNSEDLGKYFSNISNFFPLDLEEDDG